MSGRKAWLPVVVLLCCLALTSVVWAMSSTNYAIDWDVIGGGGRPMASTNYSLDGTLGQAMAGGCQSDNYGVSGGYWLGPAEERRIYYLPIIWKEP
jgi:hypothetical protein